VTEAEWLACTDPQTMLEFLRGKASDRKLRLFVADGVKTLGTIFGEDELELAGLHERVADGDATEEDLERFLLRGMPELWAHRAPGGNLPPLWDTARMVARDRFKLAPQWPSDTVTSEARAAENAEMCGALRCLFDRLPFCALPPVAPGVLAWEGGMVARMAAAVYEGGAFTPVRLAILADSLEEAGCDQTDLLGHLRGPGPHVRGCWVVDLLLGKS
jgi:hypothetical protein